MNARRVVFVVFDDATMLDLTGPMEVLGAAGNVHARSASQNDAYRFELASPAGGEVVGTHGLRIGTDVALDDVEGDIDTLIVVGGRGARRLAKDTHFCTALGRAAARCRRVTSVCTGAFLLAAAGLLDGLDATTHWASCDSLSRAFPKVNVTPDAIFVRSGRVVTSAGVTAGMDLALALVEEDLGAEVAQEVARYLVIFVRRPGGQSQFSAQLSTWSAERDSIKELQLWIVDNSTEDLRVPVLAARVGMSPRHFARVFRAELGVTPASFVERARVELARRLLETTRRDMFGVAEGAGFSSDQQLRRAFSRQLGVSPSQYRDRFSTGD